MPYQNHSLARRDRLRIAARYEAQYRLDMRRMVLPTPTCPLPNCVVIGLVG